MMNTDPIYMYLATLKEQAEGDFNAYKSKVKTAEIAFRCALTQIALELQEEGKLILIVHDFEDLSKTLKEELRYTAKAEKAKEEWLKYELMKAEEATLYIKRVQRDISGSNIDSANITTAIQHIDVPEETKVISGTQGLADFLGCGKTKAFAVIRSGVLKKAGIQYQVGKCWKFNAKKLSEYLIMNPNLLG